ncbi:MAG: nicotinate-nucleotide adenylyltransferase [Butyrivibrio sp.]|nr:nicotinate-nucleotide adenylyltransferase [Butyrivibrio sp.]
MRNKVQAFLATILALTMFFLTTMSVCASDVQLVKETTTYTVRNGDNLSKLAKIKLGDSSRWKDIYEWNKDVIKDVNLIYPGTKLVFQEAIPLKRIGVLGGTFDPIHNQHVAVAAAVYRELACDEVWLMPNGVPPHKQDRKIASGKDRIAMIEYAIADYPYMKVCTYQVDQGGLSYVGQDFEQFNKMYPNTDFYFVIGADNAYTIDKWLYFDLLIQNCNIAVAGREVQGQEKTLAEQIAYLNSTYDLNIVSLQFQSEPVSSTLVRDKLKNGEDVSEYINQNELNYIKANGLYDTVPDNVIPFPSEPSGANEALPNAG